MTGDNWRWVLGIAALGNFGNGLWMLADPAGWYRDLPAAVPDTGPLNEHFVRDIGAAFVVMAVALAWGAVRPALRVPMLGMATLFYVLHALVHVYDTMRGLLPAAHWTIDFPGVYLPALLMTALVVVLARREPLPLVNRLATVAAIVLGLVLASLPFAHYRFAAHHHAPRPPQGGFHAHHAH